MDLKKFFKFQVSSSKFQVSGERTLHVLYLGRRHPLKGVEFLERAVKEIEQSNNPNNRTIDFRIVSDHFGEELERDWAWCDVLVLPTLSENFGLVVAEAQERGKRVVTTDGAPVWGEGELFDCSGCSDCSIGYGGRLIYLKGYRDGTDEERVELLKNAIATLV
ncbi:MAG: glycosyltransferase family 4 protein [Kiritimatiellae bacterium]|nr:glycosyltransferase family 4 protein [Kiritimatiellia bacterium]